MPGTLALLSLLAQLECLASVLSYTAISFPIPLAICCYYCSSIFFIFGLIASLAILIWKKKLSLYSRFL